jgi:hypothetical protein
MEKTFNSIEFLNDLSKELVLGFEKAGKATTPVLVGSAREKEVRNKLELIFPQSIGIATGCIIDSFGHTSKQTDIVIYEKEICPVFSINDTDESTYFPCEGIIGVGEIKSTLNTTDLEDSFVKIKSVKELNRTLNNTTCWRRYCSRQSIQGADSQYYSQTEKVEDQILGFILCEKIGLTLDTFLTKCSALIKKEKTHLLPNIIVSLQDGLFIYLDSTKNQIRKSKANSDKFYNIKNPNGDFQFLLNEINFFINHGRSTDILPFEKYILKETSLPGNGKYVDL